MLHHLMPERRTLHGHFSRDLAPVLEIDSGDTVRFTTLGVRWALEPMEGDSDDGRARFEPRDPELDDGHALGGPIYVRGAKAGMTLQIDIGDLRTGGWGDTYAGGSEFLTDVRLGLMDVESTLRWTIDADAGTATTQVGGRSRTVQIAPFFGVMGMPPGRPGIYPTAPPRRTGGNLDCRELVAGTTLYLPIEVDGALFSAGDGHAAQGDGEVSITAIECPIERGDLTLTVRDDMPLTMPRARTATAWLTFGLDEDLGMATYQALGEMVDLMAAEFEVSRVDALALASVVVNLHVTQIANGVVGVHAALPHGAIR